MRTKGSPAELEERRLRAAELHRQGKGTSEVSRLVGGMLAALSVGLTSCHKEPPTFSGRDQRANAPKSQVPMQKSPADIEARWKAKPAGLNADPKSQFGASLDELVRILRDECSQADRDALLEYAAAAPGGSGKQGFPGAAIAGLVWLYVEDADRSSLVRVLARACPRKVGLRDVEDVVVRQGRTPRIQDSVTVFFDAFATSESLDARDAIATALRRGFAFAGPIPASDAELVAWCQKWYDEHGATVEANPEYGLNSNMPQPEQRYREHGLFVPKSR